LARKLNANRISRAGIAGWSSHATAMESPLGFGANPVPEPASGSPARSDVPWVIDTTVPRLLLISSTRASSCLASAAMMIVPTATNAWLNASGD
jgi:hypothetical protein